MAKKMFGISPYCYNELINRGFDLNTLYLLFLVQEGSDVAGFNNPKIAAYEQQLIRKDLITQDKKMTERGRELLDFCSSTNKRLTLKKLSTDDEFKKWWNTYPATNNFTINGKLFSGTQSKRQKEADCRMLFDRYINQGYKAEDIIKATAFHINLAKEQSGKKKENQLSYIPNSERYLREKCFEPYIELSKQPVKQELTNNKSVVDI